MSYPYRCSREACKVRRSLKRKAEEYVRTPRCRVCGSRLRLDRTAMKDRRRKKCYCDGYPFIHRKGSKWCNHYAGEITREDLIDRYGPRAG